MSFLSGVALTDEKSGADTASNGNKLDLAIVQAAVELIGVLRDLALNGGNDRVLIVGEVLAIKLEDRRLITLLGIVCPVHCGGGKK